ncbi:hypothetical protein CK203_098739, partial [Vitis vinifera]
MAAFSEGKGAPKGGKSWFAVESKTFEISIEEIGGKLRGVILERSKGFSSWIKFGEKSFSSLLEGVEDWCREESSSRRLRVWEEGGRKYRLECRSNVAVGGWFMLAQKLRALGITNQPMRNVEMGTSIFVKEDYRGVAYERWSLKGGLKISRLGGALVLFEFEDKVEADWVLLRGSRSLQMREFFLQKWGPEVGCCRNGSHPKEVWVKVVGLPLHLWSREWARILVRAPGKIRQGTLQVVAGNCCWTVEVRDEGGGDSRASGSVRVVQNGKSELQARGTGEQFECGRGQGEAAGAEGQREGGLLQPTSGMGFVERSSSARASSVPAEVEGGMEPKLMAVQVEAVVELTPRGWRVTDEALMEEASRYYAGPSPLSELGHRGYSYSSSSSFWGNAEAVGASEGLVFGAEGELGSYETRMGRNRAASACGDWSGHLRDS